MINTLSTAEVVYSTVMLSISCFCLSALEGFKKVLEPVFIVLGLFLLAVSLNFLISVMLGVLT